MRTPVSLGWVSGKVSNPFVVISDADGHAVAQAIGVTAEVAMDNARIIVCAINKHAEVE